MIWAKEETLSRGEIEEIQLKRLQETVERNYNRFPLTAQRWKRPA